MMKLGYLAIVFFSALVIGGIFLQIRANQPQPAPPLSFEGTFFTEREWYLIGQEIARLKGLVGTPTEEYGVIMTFGSYVTLNPNYQIDNRFERDHPVFVYQAFGNVPMLAGSGSDSGPQDKIGAIQVVFDATDGFPFSTSVTRRDQALDLSFIPMDAGIVRPTVIAPTLPPTLPPAENSDPELIPMP